MNTDNKENAKLTNKDLFERQKKLLDTFLAHGAITKAQYDKSLSCLIEKLQK